MAKYLVKGNYLVDGEKGLLKDGGTGRRAGGRLRNRQVDAGGVDAALGRRLVEVDRPGLRLDGRRVP